jgi:uncharacterized protein HemX
VPTTSTDPSPEVLERAGTTGRRHRLTAVALVAILGLGLVALAEGARRAPAEEVALERCAERATSAVERAERRLSAMARYIAPQLGMATADLDAQLLQLVARQAPAARTSVDRSLRACRGVDVWPLNRDHRRVRAAYVDLLVAEQSRLQRIARDGRAFYDGYPQVRSLRDEALSLTP